MSSRCPTCGTVYTGDARFCTKDGVRLVPFEPGTARWTAPRRETPGTGKKVVSHADLEGTVLDGRYAIGRKVGEGGMSHVYLAHDAVTNERFAIKVLSPSLSEDENAMARLRREAALGSRLAHPNVCHIVRMGETAAGLVYVVMPFVEGEILSDRNSRMGVIPIAMTARFISDIAAGLHLAHELEIIHRDLKPENIMICRKPDGTEFAVLMDFGLAKERQAGSELQKLTSTGVILGTPEFLSPEQLRGKPLDARTDVYSLTLMAYEMLTGELPFEGSTQQELMVARLRNDPVPLRQRSAGKGMPAAIERVLLKGMARNPDDRYESTLAFAEALRAAAEGSRA